MVTERRRCELRRTPVPFVWGRGKAHAEEDTKTPHVIQQSAKAISCNSSTLLSSLLMGQTVPQKEDRYSNNSREKSGLK